MASTGASERVMVVDDETSIRHLAQAFLTEAGYQVDTFPDPLEAWQTLRQSPKAWDLLITDQTMPGMSGEQLAAKVMAIRPQMPVLLCSGYHYPVAGAKKAGVSAFLPKPLNREALLTSVAQILNKAVA